jgi:hypothetical protein
MRSNCWIEALRHWARGGGGGYFIERTQQTALIPHVGVIVKMHPDTVIRHFQPSTRRFGLAAFLHMFWFRGEVIEERYGEHLARIEREKNGSNT